MASVNEMLDDTLINAADEVRIRQDLVLTALGRRPADRALRVGRLLDVHSRSWSEDQEIIFKGRRIAWVGSAGSYPGKVRERLHRPDLAAVPGFGEVHKHIESSHLTPEWEAALVLPHGIPGHVRRATNSRTSTARAISNSGSRHAAADRR
jgi:adenine deaminase